MTIRASRLTFAALALLASAQLALAAPGAAGHSHGDEIAYGKPGDPKKPTRVVQIAISDHALHDNIGKEDDQ